MERECKSRGITGRSQWTEIHVKAREEMVGKEKHERGKKAMDGADEERDKIRRGGSRGRSLLVLK